jgi:guanosine-3',5'-bis(diphosphate) 3'-pyrophosphohydrolase
MKSAARKVGASHPRGGARRAPAGFALVLEAAEFAADRHRRQRRKDVHATPYINHPLALARLLSNEGGVDDPEILAAALLHDTIEDTETTAAELRERFGARVAAIVEEVTDDPDLDYLARKRRQVERASSISREARLVKLADKTCNLRDVASNPPREWTLSRRREYFDWACEVVDRLRGVHPTLEAIFDAAVAARP